MKDEAAFLELALLLFLLHQWLNGRTGGSMNIVCSNRFGHPKFVRVPSKK